MTMRIGNLAAGTAVAALICLTFAAAQPPPQGQRAPTLDERVGALERELASLGTRFELRNSAVPSALGGTLEPRVADLERTLDRLAVDLQRVERQADSAFREASDARREAMNASRDARDARDAAMRAR